MIRNIILEAIEEHPIISGAKRSKFKTVEDWLHSICEGKKPGKLISDYIINLSFSDSKSSPEYTLFLYGQNSYLDEQNRSVTRIDFEPTNMFLSLPKGKYKNLDYEAVKEKIVSQLKNFTETEKFQASFLSAANITIGFSEEKIWLKM